ncbi:NADPH-dependent FMN reductase [Corynebacterium hylobatis]|nr:NAD(P)H-dependent oxidoreductase [Corynebacterium hylobatis]
MKIAVFVGSIRNGRHGRTVGQWALDQLQARGDGNTYELIDLIEQDLDQLTAAVPPIMAAGTYDEVKTTAWSGTISSYDGFIFVTPEYNASVPGTMKNAFDLLKVEWEGKPVGFLSYGGGGGVRAVNHWRDIVANVGMLPLEAQAALAFDDHFVDFQFAPNEQTVELLEAVAAELVQVGEKATVNA